MPQFVLNGNRRASRFANLDSFTQGYIEAMFFTNGDTGDDREDYLNELGIDRLTQEAIEDIKADCASFQAINAAALKAALEDGTYDDEQAGHDFWFTRQHHGVGFWDRDTLSETLQLTLTNAAHAQGEAYVETYRGWVYHR